MPAHTQKEYLLYDKSIPRAVYTADILTGTLAGYVYSLLDKRTGYDYLININVYSLCLDNDACFIIPEREKITFSIRLLNCQLHFLSWWICWIWFLDPFYKRWLVSYNQCVKIYHYTIILTLKTGISRVRLNQAGLFIKLFDNLRWYLTVMHKGFIYNPMLNFWRQVLV